MQARGSQDVFFELEVRLEEVPVSTRACYPWSEDLSACGHLVELQAEEELFHVVRPQHQ